MQQLNLQIAIPIIILPILLLVWQRLRLKKLKEYASPLLGKIEVFQKYNGERVLATNGFPQGVSIHDESINKSYWYKIAAETCKFCLGKKNPQVLMLGLGACTIPNLIARKNPKIHQTIVEIDPQIIRACRDFFNLNKLSNLKLIQADAYKFFNKVKNLKFDVIIVDIFIGLPPYVDIKSNRQNFIESLLPYLKKDGMIAFNRPAHNDKVREDGQKLERYLATIFKKTEIFYIKDPRRFWNHVITGSILQIKKI